MTYLPTLQLNYIVGIIKKELIEFEKYFPDFDPYFDIKIHPKLRRDGKGRKFLVRKNYLTNEWEKIDNSEIIENTMTESHFRYKIRRNEISKNNHVDKRSEEQKQIDQEIKKRKKERKEKKDQENNNNNRQNAESESLELDEGEIQKKRILSDLEIKEQFLLDKLRKDRMIIEGDIIFDETLTIKTGLPDHLQGVISIGDIIPNNPDEINNERGKIKKIGKY